jgi:hypothetical protein
LPATIANAPAEALAAFYAPGLGFLVSDRFLVEKGSWADAVA